MSQPQPNSIDPTPSTPADPLGPLDQSRRVFYELHAGDRVEVDHEVKVGQQSWRVQTSGVVEKIRRERRGLHFDRNRDDKHFSDCLTLRLDDGSLSTITLDGFTQLRRLEAASDNRG